MEKKSGNYYSGIGYCRTGEDMVIIEKKMETAIYGQGPSYIVIIEKKTETTL